MPIPAEFLDELKARLDLVAIVSRHVALTRRGREHLGPLPIPPGEDPVVHRQRAEGLLPLLRLRRAWHRHRLRHAARAHVLSRRGRVAGRRRRPAHAGGGAARPGEGGPPRRPLRRQRGGGGALPGSSQERRRPRRLGLPAPARPRRGADRPLPLGLCPGGCGPPPGAASGRLCRRRAGGDGPGGSPGGSGPPALRALPRPGDVSHRGRPRADRRLRRPGHGRRPAQVPQHRRDRALPQGQPALRPRPRGGGSAQARHAWWWWKATWT